MSVKRPKPGRNRFQKALPSAHAQKNTGASGQEEKNTPEFHVSFAEKAFKALELPVDTVSGLPHLELSGNREAVVDGCRGILEYDENIVRINAGKMVLRFTGRGFHIKNLKTDSVMIQGFFTSIEFLF